MVSKKSRYKAETQSALKSRHRLPQTLGHDVRLHLWTARVRPALPIAFQDSAMLESDRGVEHRKILLLHVRQTRIDR
jgi:hypothetical protein